MFGGGFFGKPVPMKGAGMPGGAVPLGGQGGQGGMPKGTLGVVPAQTTAQVTSPVQRPAAAPAAPAQGFQPQPLIPPTRVPMGAKKDCPICRG